MASWKKVIVSGSQAHLQSITASGGVSASGNLSITGISTLTGRLSADGAISTTNITASGNISSSAGLIGQTLSISGAGTIGGLLTANGAITTTNLTASGNISSSGNLSVTGTSTLTGRLTAGGAISTTTITASGNISSSGNLIVTGNITASGLPSSTTPQIVGFNTTTGGLSYFDTSSIVAGAAAAIQTFKTVSVGGVSLVADQTQDTLTIASGSFGGVATTRNNLRLSGSQEDTLTISFLDSPTFTQITASGNISSSAGLIGQTLTTSGGATVGGNLTVTGEAALGNNSGDQITLGGGVIDTVIVQGLFTLGDNLLNSNLIPTFGNNVVIGSSSKAIQSIVVNQITASGLPQTAPGSRQVLMIDSSTGAVVRVTAASLSGSVGVDSFRTISIGGVGGSGGPVVADSSTDTLNISSSDANLTVVGDSGTDTITFDFSNSPIFTHITASGNISSSGNLTVTGTSTLTGRLTAGGAITTTNVTASGNISSSAGLIGGTLTTSGNANVGGDATITGDIAVNGGDITTTSTGTATIFNTNATTINIGAAATNINMGASNGTVTIAGNLTVNGDTTILDTTNLTVEDKFIILAHGSGSQTPISEGGIIIEGGTADKGQAFLFNSGSTVGSTGRWGLAADVHMTASNVTPTDYIMSVSSSAADPTLAPTYGSASAGFGNVHINTQSKTIWMYI